ncbi:MAG: DUF4351 domain-containing protein [Planctomycetes bacterium]|nr:DUF4351 domain-containing protein [Planctomycetota bacterium]
MSGYLDFKLSIAYKVIKLWEVDPRPIFELESPGLLPFVPFMAGNPESLVLKSCEKIAKCSEALAGMETKRELLAILSGLAGKVIKDEVLRGHLISEIRVMGENFILDYFREEGIAIGKVQGWEEGRQEGLLEGARQEARLAVLRVVRRRFGELPPELSERLEVFKDLQRLESLLDEAMVCPSLEAFLALL